VRWSSTGAIVFLAGLSGRRQLRSKKTVLAVGFLGLIAATVVVAGTVHPLSSRQFGLDILVRVYGGFFVPLLALAYGTGALGDDRDEKSLIHILVRPIPRVGAYAGKLLAAALIALPFSMLGLALLCVLGQARMAEGSANLFGALWPAIFLATLVYLCFFQLLAAAFRHSTVIGIAYVFFIEVIIVLMPGILKRISIQFYANSLAYHRGSEIGVVPSDRELKLYLPVDGPTAMWTLIGLAVVLFALGALIFSRKEYRDSA
jgi:ABC-2 type transport system permease protein